TSARRCARTGAFPGRCPVGGCPGLACHGAGGGEVMCDVSSQAPGAGVAVGSAAKRKARR
ncbi:hypothetical protein, partial [Neptunomonas sp.]|uniref:hypothetical protein n=1 Tax=Neptunomonas sp. TaxID=1971898 RepID=UPI003568BB30